MPTPDVTAAQETNTRKRDIRGEQPGSYC